MCAINFWSLQNADCRLGAKCRLSILINKYAMECHFITYLVPRNCHFSQTLVLLWNIPILCLPRGVLRISSDRGDQMIFLGLKFLILGFFWVRKFGRFFFLGRLIWVGILLGIKKNLLCPGCVVL